MKKRIHNLLGPVVLSVGGLIVCGGCPTPASAPPPPEAVMAGIWRLTTDTPTNLPGTTLSFDADGNLTEVTYTANGVTITQTPITRSTVVNGSVVSISATFGNASRLDFAGTLNSAGTQVQGNLVVVINQGVFNINIDNAPATLTRL